MAKTHRFTHFIDNDNFRLTPDEKKVEVDCVEDGGVVTVKHIHLTPDLIRCIDSFTHLCNDIEMEADALFGSPEFPVVFEHNQEELQTA